MKEMTFNSNTTQGVSNMKKTVLVVALAMMLVFAFSSVALAKNAGSPAIIGDNTGAKATSSVNATSGYVYWSAATRAASLDANQAIAGPHGNYTTTTIKCATCHSVHGANSAGKVLLQSGASGATCNFCHYSGSTVIPADKQVSLNAGGVSNTPHGGCLGYCHSTSPHGVGASEYLTLKANLLTDFADGRIGGAITNTANTGITAAIMNDTASHDGVTLGTGYICSRSGCHANAGSAFSIKGSNNTMLLQDAAAQTKTGHPVLGAATTTWTQAGHGISAEEPWVPAEKQIAFKGLQTGCNSCHDYVDPATTNPAFPHNRLGTRLWMNSAANAGSATTSITADPGYYSTSVDGACLKCHVNASGTVGVGKTY
jgi:hypothetical protein